VSALTDLAATITLWWNVWNQILIVDDDPGSAHVSTLLEKRGYAILTAGDGEEGILRADTFRPDLIITDV